MSALVLAAFFAILAIAFPFIAFFFRPKTKVVNQQEESLSELRASVIFLQTALPTLLFILAALGFSTYDTIVKTVTYTVTTEAKDYLKKVKIDSLVNDIQASRQRAEEAAGWIVAMQQGGNDSLRAISREVVLRLLPKGTIVPFSGRAGDIDNQYWAICDGKNGTPDLTNRFIMGSTFRGRGVTGGNSSHTHQATSRLDARIIKTNEVKFPLKEGQGSSYNIERHEHQFRIVRQTVSLTRNEHLPPYYRLVYLMKIR